MHLIYSQSLALYLNLFDVSSDTPALLILSTAGLSVKLLCRDEVHNQRPEKYNEYITAIKLGTSFATSDGVMGPITDGRRLLFSFRLRKAVRTRVVGIFDGNRHESTNPNLDIQIAQHLRRKWANPSRLLLHPEGGGNGFCEYAEKILQKFRAPLS